MTKENKGLRNKLMAIENLIVKALAHQPQEDGDCQLHLLKTLGKVGGMSAEYAGIVEVRVRNIVWDTDGQKVKGLPKTVRLVMHPAEDMDDTVLNALSDTYHWCVRSCDWEVMGG